MENSDAYQSAVDSGGEYRGCRSESRSWGSIRIEPAIDEIRRCSGLHDWDPIAVKTRWRAHEQALGTAIG